MRPVWWHGVVYRRRSQIVSSRAGGFLKWMRPLSGHRLLLCPYSPSRHISVRQLILGDTRNFSGVIDTSVFASFLVSSETSAS